MEAIAESQLAQYPPNQQLWRRTPRADRPHVLRSRGCIVNVRHGSRPVRNSPLDQAIDVPEQLATRFRITAMKRTRDDQREVCGRDFCALLLRHLLLQCEQETIPCAWCLSKHLAPTVFAGCFQADRRQSFRRESWVVILPGTRKQHIRAAFNVIRSSRWLQSRQTQQFSEVILERSSGARSSAIADARGEVDESLEVAKALAYRWCDQLPLDALKQLELRIAPGDELFVTRTMRKIRIAGGQRCTRSRRKRRTIREATQRSEKRSKLQLKTLIQRRGRRRSVPVENCNAIDQPDSKIRLHGVNAVVPVDDEREELSHGLRHEHQQRSDLLVAQVLETAPELGEPVLGA